MRQNISQTIYVNSKVLRVKNKTEKHKAVQTQKRYYAHVEDSEGRKQEHNVKSFYQGWADRHNSLS